MGTGAAIEIEGILHGIARKGAVYARIGAVAHAVGCVRDGELACIYVVVAHEAEVVEIYLVLVGLVEDNLDGIHLGEVHIFRKLAQRDAIRFPRTRGGIAARPVITGVEGIRVALVGGYQLCGETTATPAFHLCKVSVHIEGEVLAIRHIEVAEANADAVLDIVATRILAVQMAMEQVVVGIALVHASLKRAYHAYPVVQHTYGRGAIGIGVDRLHFGGVVRGRGCLGDVHHRVGMHAGGNCHQQHPQER